MERSELLDGTGISCECEYLYCHSSSGTLASIDGVRRSNGGLSHERTAQRQVDCEEDGMGVESNATFVEVRDFCGALGCCSGFDGEVVDYGDAEPGANACSGDIASLSVYRCSDGAVLSADGVVTSSLVSGAN
eukprot:6481156-Amphidinium_carterae.2